MTAPGDVVEAALPADAELVARFTRNPESFTAVYDRYFRDVHRYVASRLDTHAADDISAETFLVAFRKRDRFDPARGALRPWLLGIATNLVADHRRAETRRYRALARAGTDPDTESHETRVVTWVSTEGLLPLLAGALARLSQAERDVVLLVALGQLTHDEVAQALGIPYGTVGSRLSRARKKLRLALDQENLPDE